jgi:3-hydroxyisobutyrate dehydrogenase
MSEPQKIAWIGTGVMGASMCGHLIAAGHDVVLYTRTREKAAPLLDRGARWMATPREAAAQSDVIFTMVGMPEDVRQVYLGADGILAGAKKGAIAVDMTSTSPSLAVEIDEAARAIGVATVDAPVSGGDIGARNATLSIMVGGDAETIARVRPLFELMGRSIVHQGRAGAGQHTKLCNQIVIAGTMIGVCESLLYGQRAGLNLDTMLQSISGGAASCWALTNLAPRVLKGDFEPGFFIDHFVKDMGIALEECRRMKLKLPGLTMVHALYQRAQQLGYGRKGTQALYRALEEMNGLKA